MQKNNPFKILFVCTGNTCRSPAALYIARQLLQTTLAAARV